MFKDSSRPVRILGNLIMLLTAVLLFAHFYTSMTFQYDRSDFIEFGTMPQTLSAKTLEAEHKFHAGEGFILRNTLVKHEVGCFAEYQTNLIGPVNIQLPVRRSSIIGQRGITTSATVNAFHDLPANAPKGWYRIQVIAFPICDGVPRDPFIIKGSSALIQVY